MGLFLLFGFASLLAQALLLREITQVFGAHELSLAAGLSCWLLWTAAGARLGRGAAEEDFHGRALVFALAAPLSLLAARHAPGLLPALYQPGLFAILAGPALLCLPAALVNGWAAAAALRVRPGYFYAAEAAGSAVAGLLAVAYYHSFPGVEAFLLLAAPALIFAAAWAARRPFSPLRACAAACVLLLLLAGGRAAPRLWTLKPPALPPMLAIQTQGSGLALTKMRGDLAFYEDGRLLHSPGDDAPEYLVHLPLLALKKPGRVLLHGGGAWFALPEVLKHAPAGVDIAEPDRFRAEALARWTGADPAKYALLPADPRLLRGRDGAYSAIFNAGGAPENAAQNRFYTVEYFRAAARLLAPGGVLVFQLPFAENYVPPRAAYAAACVLASARSVFPSVTVIPGARLTALASTKPLALDPAALSAVYRARKLKSKAVTPETLPFLLHPYRLAWAEAELARVKRPPLNTDLDPLAYFNFWRSWLSMVLSPAAFLGLAGLAAAGLFAAWRLKDELRFAPGERGGEAFLIGFWGLAFETSALLAFQARSGRLSPELGGLFALFMAGAAIGARAGAGRERLALYAEGAALLLALAAALRPELAQQAWGARLFILAGGTVSGIFFAAAAARDGAGVYARDLAGGAAGGLAAAAFAAPLAGIAGAFYLSGLAALAALSGGLWRSSKESTVKE